MFSVTKNRDTFISLAAYGLWSKGDTKILSQLDFFSQEGEASQVSDSRIA